MKLKDYLNHLNGLVEQNKELLELDVVYSVDDEGNGFDKVKYFPCIGTYESGSFITFREDSHKGDLNAICIN